MRGPSPLTHPTKVTSSENLSRTSGGASLASEHDHWRAGAAGHSLPHKRVAFSPMSVGEQPGTPDSHHFIVASRPGAPSQSPMLPHEIYPLACASRPGPPSTSPLFPLAAH